MTMNNKLTLMLANLVFLFHTLIVLIMLIIPFSNTPYFFIMHITFSISLLVHWYNNSNICALSVLESSLRGLDYTESFTHKFIAPVYEISQTEWSQICYIIVIVLMWFSIYKLYNSILWNEVRLNFSNLDANSSIIDKIKCLNPLFVC